MMKKILLSFCILISGLTLAQSNLPACISPPFNNCYGEWVYESGDKYIGEWFNNKKNGQGTYTWVNGNKYVGQWVGNDYNGQGSMFFTNGNKYQGQFMSGKYHGQGKFTWADGWYYIGQYKDSKRNGLGTQYSPNGSVYQQGLWSDDNFVQAQSITPKVVPVAPKPPAITSNPQEIKRQKCIRLGLAPGSTDFNQCMN